MPVPSGIVRCQAGRIGSFSSAVRIFLAEDISARVTSCDLTIRGKQKAVMRRNIKYFMIMDLILVSLYLIIVLPAGLDPSKIQGLNYGYQLNALC
jgi:hypothetical protein